MNELYKLKEEINCKSNSKHIFSLDKNIPEYEELRENGKANWK